MISGCWKCGEKLTDHFQMNSMEMKGTKLPAPGDISICGACGAIHQFDGYMRLIKPSSDFLKAAEATPAIQDLRERLVKRK